MFEQELNEYWRTVVNTIQDGVMIVDTDGIIISANKALEKTSGYTHNELIGKPCSILTQVPRFFKGRNFFNIRIFNNIRVLCESGVFGINS